MLIYSEMMVRAGPPLGLPYQGSKKKISRQIVEIIKQNFGVDKPIYDIFGGGGAITAECLMQGLEVYYNDIDKNITDCFQRVISQDREWLKTLIVSREEFLRIRDRPEKTTDDHLKLLVNSFGNNKTGYLYGADTADEKFELAVKIITNHDVFSGYKQTEIYNHAFRELEQLQRAEQLERLQQLNLTVSNQDYQNFDNVKSAIVYLDPPYENTRLDGYGLYCFDSSALYDWAFKMSKTNIVLISSYEVSDDRFVVAYEFEKARSTLQGGKHKDDDKYERLFMTREQLAQYESEQLTLF